MGEGPKGLDPPAPSSARRRLLARTTTKEAISTITSPTSSAVSVLEAADCSEATLAVRLALDNPGGLGPNSVSKYAELQTTEPTCLIVSSRTSKRYGKCFQTTSAAALS
jgi:hypothetical protein